MVNNNWLLVISGVSLMVTGFFIGNETLVSTGLLFIAIDYAADRVIKEERNRGN